MLVQHLVQTKHVRYSSNFYNFNPTAAQIAAQEVEWGMEYCRKYSFGDFETMIEAMSNEVDRLRRNIWIVVDK